MSKDILDMFSSFKIVLCTCPCCNNLHRISDLRLSYAGKATQTWLDEFEVKLYALEKKKQNFEEKERAVRDAGIERGRKKVLGMINKSMCKELAKLNFNPYDIKCIMHPIEFIIFNGMNNNKIKNIVLLSKSQDSKLLDLHRSIEKTIESEKYDWKVARVNLSGNIVYE